MYLLRRITPFIAGLLFFLILILTIYLPKNITSINFHSWSYIIYTMLVGCLISISAIFFIGTGEKITTQIRFSPFLLISWIGGFTIFMFSERPYILWVIIFVLPLIFWIWLESLYFFWQRSESYQAYTLQRIANYLYIIEIFLFITALIGLQVIFQIQLWLILIIFLFGMFFIQYDYLLLNKLSSQESLIVAAIGTLLAVQFYLVLNLLPTHFFMYGLTISLFFYVWLGINCQLLKKELKTSSAVTYMLLGGGGFVLVFITSLII